MSYFPNFQKPKKTNPFPSLNLKPKPLDTPNQNPILTLSKPLPTLLHCKYFYNAVPSTNNVQYCKALW